MAPPTDLVRATLEQAWQAECDSDIYLARQVVELRGLVAADRAEIGRLRKAGRALLEAMKRLDTPDRVVEILPEEDAFRAALDATRELAAARTTIAEQAAELEQLRALRTAVQEARTDGTLRCPAPVRSALYAALDAAPTRKDDR